MKKLILPALIGLVSLTLLIGCSGLALPILVIIYIVSECCLTRFSGRDATSKDRGSWQGFALASIVGIPGSILAAYYFRAGILLEWYLFYVFGVCVFAAGLVLRTYSIIYLGRFFTLNVAIATDHRLIDSGPYRFIRHPAYTGGLMLCFGFGLSIGNWLSVVIIVVPTLAACWWRMKIEEAALLEALGEPYRRYMKRTKRLVPMIY
jgi:protein-S-isoprenylcysteine O-methyltransferase